MDAHLLHRYGTPAGAAAYRRKYGRSLLRRWSNRRELAIVLAALEQVGARGRLLDCPCGAGRLVPTLLRRAEHVTAVDLSPAMVAEAKDALAPLLAEGRVDLGVASADHLPFPDRAFDTAVCHRLLHHVAEPDARARIFAELARVSKRGVVVAFQDATAFKTRWRAKRHPGRRIALAPDVLAREAEQAAGLRLLPPCRRISGLFSMLAVAAFRTKGAEDAGPGTP